MTDLAALFDQAAAGYDAARRSLVPQFDAFYGAAVAAVPRLLPGARLLDLGAGTGLMAGLIAARDPGLNVTLLDVSTEMLEEARARFAALAPARLTLTVADYADTLPDGPFEATVSALSIHHLDDAAKVRLFRAVLARLGPGGVFVNADQVGGATPAEERALDRAWERQARAAGADDQMIAAARRRMVHDRAVPAARQLGWLQEAGFDDARILWAGGRFAVLAGRRPDRTLRFGGGYGTQTARPSAVRSESCEKTPNRTA